MCRAPGLADSPGSCARKEYHCIIVESIYDECVSQCIVNVCRCVPLCGVGWRDDIFGPIRRAFLAYAALCVSLVRPGSGPHIMALVSRARYAPLERSVWTAPPPEERAAISSPPVLTLCCVCPDSAACCIAASPAFCRVDALSAAPPRPLPKM